MDLLQLQYFRTIARLENLTRASELLYVAQPNLSVSLKRLEEEMGVSLFDRRRGKIRLTPAGKLFLSYVDRVLNELDEGIGQTRQSQMRANEQVCVVNSIVDLMGSLLTAFFAEHRQVSFRQINSRNREIPGKILAGDADFGLLFGSCAQPGLEYIMVDSCERVIQLARDHPLAARGIVSLEEMNGQRFICNQSRDDEECLAELTRTAGFRPNLFFECDDNRVELSMMLHSGGVALAPVSNYLKLINGDLSLPLTCLRVREPLPQAQLGMIRRSGDLLSQTALQFYEMVSRFFVHESEIAQRFVGTLPER